MRGTPPPVLTSFSSAPCAEAGSPNFVTEHPKAWKYRYCLPCRRAFAKSKAATTGG